MKKLISVILSVLLVMSFFTFSVSAATDNEPFSNTSDTSDMFDYLLIKAIYFGTYTPTDDETSRSDVNADGSIDMFDYLAVKRAYFKDSIGAGNTPINYTSHSLLGYIEKLEIEAFLSSKANGDEIPSFLITSKEELDTLVAMTDNYGGEGGQFSDFASSLSESYFDEKALLVAYAAASSGGDFVAIQGVHAANGTVTLTLGLYEWGVTCDMQYRLMAAELNKADINGNGNFRAVIHRIGHISYS